METAIAHSFARNTPNGGCDSIATTALLERSNGRENFMPLVPTPSTFEIDVSCPNCGTKTKKSLVWLRDNDEFVCNHCGTIVDQCRQLVVEVEKTTNAR
jgi:ribosomal protein S27E